MPTLWKFDVSPPATAVRILADSIGVHLDNIDVDIVKLEHKTPEYMKLNPLGTVPLLKDGDFFLADSHAMMKYLLSKYGSPSQQERLYPSGIEARALVDQALYFDTGVLFNKVKMITLPTLIEGLTGITDRHIKEIETAYAVVEAYLGDKEFVAADHLTLADLSIGCSMECLDSLHAVNKDKYPKIKAWLGRLENIPAFKKYNNPGPRAVGPLISTLWERNSKK